MSTAGNTVASFPSAARAAMDTLQASPGRAATLVPALRAGAGPGLIRRLGCSAIAPAARPARISCMLVAIIAMSLADLYMTLAHLLHFGMIEANPLARRIMETGSPAELITWKLTTVLIAIGILFVFRYRRTAEVGALAGFLVMAWLTAHWFNYNGEVSMLTADMHAIAGEHGFVSMAPGGRGE